MEVLPIDKSGNGREDSTTCRRRRNSRDSLESANQPCRLIDSTIQTDSINYSAQVPNFHIIKRWLDTLALKSMHFHTNSPYTLAYIARIRNGGGDTNLPRTVIRFSWVVHYYLSRANCKNSLTLFKDADVPP